MGVLSGLEPTDVFGYFEELTKIPHGSGNMTAISDYVAGVIRDAGVFVTQDALKNVIAVSEATPGYENAPAVMLQGHLDMVAEKTADSDHDFKKDPLKIFLEGDRIHADRTTLGGDDGVAVAFMLALLTRKDLKHPRLECVFTTDEETGMFGADAVDLSFSNARYLLNLDNEAEGIFTVSCAGGARFEGILPVRRVEKNGSVFRITVQSGKGGHSGTEIFRDRPNTNVVAAELLQDLKDRDPSLSVISIAGGLMDNAIPMKTELLVLAEKEPSLEALEAAYQQEFESSDDTVHFTLERLPHHEKAFVFTPGSEEAMLFAFRLCPNGAQKYNHKIKGLVQTSLNLGIVKTEEERFILRASVRSSVETEKERLLEKLSMIFEKAGGTGTTSGNYPGWAYRSESPFRDLCTRVWNELYPEKPAVIEAIHAGLECGLLLEKKPDLDIVSIGPDARYIHTPREEISVSSVRRVFAYVVELLESIQ
ncbi:MAG: beta-Ala-His dipeptidase [Lachnospiraceae bacterium]|nr:beta-Ala-His dipeptidase [Lachnospiraceae bacterium]